MAYEIHHNAAKNDDLFNASGEAIAEQNSTVVDDNAIPHKSATPSEQTKPEVPMPAAAADGMAGGGGAVSKDNAPPGLGHNRKVYIRDLVLDPRFHERRAFDPDDVARLAPLISNTAFHRPVPVVQKDGNLCHVDSTVWCQARLAADPDAMTFVEIVSVAEGIAIRQKDNARRAKREPMSKARRALILTNAGIPTEDIISMLGVVKSRISQLNTIARTEAEFEGMAALTVNRSMTPPNFFSSIHDTRVMRGKLDKAKPNNDGPSRVEQLEAQIAEIIAENKLLTLDEIRNRLGLNDKRTATKPVRMRGTRVTRDGLKLKLAADKKRRTISIDPSFSAKGFANLIDKVAEFLIEQQKVEGSQA